MFLPNEPNRKICKCLGMRLLRKNWSWVCFAKRGKKQEINAEKQRWKGGF
jgi:hypothetical protein